MTDNSAEQEGVQPALTAEEWAADPIGGDVVDGYINWNLGTVDVRDTHSAAPGRFRHALAALALHGQTFGFTREDVELLRDVALTMAKSPTCTCADCGARREPYLCLADRIAALLPPE